MIRDFGYFTNNNGDTFLTPNIYQMSNEEVDEDNIIENKLNDINKSDYYRYIESINGNIISYLLFYHFNFDFDVAIEDGLYREDILPEVGHIDFTLLKDDECNIRNIFTNPNRDDFLIPNV